MPIPDSLQRLLAEIFEIPPAQVTPELSASAIATWDSFRHLQAILAAENEYGVQFDPNRIPNLTTVAAILAELVTLGATFDAAAGA